MSSCVSLKEKHTPMEDCTLRSGSRQQVLKCGVCHRIYRSRKVLARHVYKHEHPTVFTCSDCGKTFPTKTRLNIHSRVHSGDRPFKCSYCPAHFASTFQLRLHHRRHTGEKPYICSYCKKSFSSSSGLQQHVKTHTNESPFSCGLCSRSFKQKEKLKQHERIHAGVRPYMCDRCPSTFRVKNSLIRHLRIHSGEMFQCMLCPKEFGELYSLKKHHRRQHGKLPFTSPAKKLISEDKTMSIDTDSSLAKHITASPAQIKKNTLKNQKQQQVQRRSWRKVKHTSDTELNKIVAEKLHLAIGHSDGPNVVDEYGWHRIPLPETSDLLMRKIEPHNGNLRKVTSGLNRQQHDNVLQGQRGSSDVETVFEQKECLAADICEHKPANVNQPHQQGQPASDAGSSRREATRPSTIEYFPSTEQTSRCEYVDNRESSQFVVSPPPAFTSDCSVQNPLCVPQSGNLLLRCFHPANLEDCGAVFPRFSSRLCHQNLRDTDADKPQTSNPGSFYHCHRLCQLGDKHHHHHHHTATLHHHPDACQTGDLPAYCVHEQRNSLSTPQQAQTCPGSLWPKQQFQSLEATAFGENPNYIQHHLPGSYQQKSLDLTQLQKSPGLTQVQTSPGLTQVQTSPGLTQVQTSPGLTQLQTSSQLCQSLFPVTLLSSSPSSSSVPFEHKSLSQGVVSSALPFSQSLVEKTYQPMLCRQASVRSGHQFLPQQVCVKSNQPSVSQHESVQPNQQCRSSQESVKSDCHFSHVRCPIKSIHPLLHDHEMIQSNQQLLRQKTSTADQQQPPESNQLEPFCNSRLTAESSTEPNTPVSRACMLSDTAPGHSVQTCSHWTFSVIYHRPSCLGPPDSPGEAGSDNSWQIYPHMQQPHSNFHHHDLTPSFSADIQSSSANMSACPGHSDTFVRGQNPLVIAIAAAANLGLPVATDDTNIINKGHSGHMYCEPVQPLAPGGGHLSLSTGLPVQEHMMPSDTQQIRAAALPLKDCSHTQEVCSDTQEVCSDTQEGCSNIQEGCSDIQTECSESHQVEQDVHQVRSCSPNAHESVKESRNVGSCSLQDELGHLPEKFVAVAKPSVTFTRSTDLHTLEHAEASHVCEQVMPDKDVGSESVRQPSQEDKTQLLNESNAGSEHDSGDNNEKSSNIIIEPCENRAISVGTNAGSAVCVKAGDGGGGESTTTHRKSNCGSVSSDRPWSNDCVSKYRNVSDVSSCGRESGRMRGGASEDKTHSGLKSRSLNSVGLKSRSLNDAALREGGRCSWRGEATCRRDSTRQMSESGSLDLSQHGTSPANLTQTDVLCSHRSQQQCPVSLTQTDVLCSHRSQQKGPQSRSTSISLCESEWTESTKKDIVCFDRIKENLSKVRRRNKHCTSASNRTKGGKYADKLDKGMVDSGQPWVVAAETVAASSQTSAEAVSQLGLIPDHVHVASDKNEHLPCEKDYSQASQLEHHKSRRQTHTVRHECDVCSKQFPYRSHLQRHMKVHVAQKPYPCHLCPQMFTAKKYLDNHIRRHNKQPAIFSCTDCKKIFGRSYQLKIHMRAHSGEKPYKCSQCSRHFATSFQVQLHERVHSDVRPYQCQHCSKCFRSKANLALHVKRHSNDRQYWCATCGAAFYEASKLVAHVRVHTGVHPFMCDQCPKTFKVKHLLVRHLRWHSSNTFNCEHCHKQFDEKWNLRAHIAKRHSGK